MSDPEQFVLSSQGVRKNNYEARLFCTFSYLCLFLFLNVIQSLAPDIILLWNIVVVQICFISFMSYVDGSYYLSAVHHCHQEIRGDSFLLFIKQCQNEMKKNNPRPHDGNKIEKANHNKVNCWVITLNGEEVQKCRQENIISRNFSTGPSD